MKCLMLLLALGLASSDKLDRTYLPPPGSKIAGGSDGAIQVPLEFPKETYSTTLRPLQPGQKEDELFGDKQSTEIYRGTGLQNIPQRSQLGPVTTGPTTFQLQNNVPTTTTTYAFTQTTTFPPEGFETTVNPIGSLFPTDVSSQTDVVGYTPFGQSQVYPQPPSSFPPGIQAGQRPGVLTPSVIQYPSYQTPEKNLISHPGYNQQSLVQNFPGQTQSSNSATPLPGSQSTQSSFDQGYTQHLGVQPPKQFGEKVPTSTLAPQVIPETYKPVSSGYYGNNIQPTQIPQSLGGQPSDVHYVTDAQGNIVPIAQDLGGQRPLFGGQPTPGQSNIYNKDIGVNIPTTLESQQPGQLFPYSPSTPIGSQQAASPQYNNIAPGANTSKPDPRYPMQAVGQQGYYPVFDSQRTIYPTSKPRLQDGTSAMSTYPQIDGQSQFNTQQGLIPSNISPQGTNYQPGTQLYQPGTDGINQADNKLNNLQQGFSQATPNQSIITGNLPQTTAFRGQPNTLFPQRSGSVRLTDNKFPTQQLPGRPEVQNTYPSSTTPASFTSPEYNQPSYSSTTVGTTPSSTISPAGILSTTPYTPLQQNIPGRFDHHPERPQTESNRNAEILSYKNILRPDGNFEYRFDTSNGIHADENGTSVDGVKAEGSYSYIGDDGKLYSVVYSADENGFRPQGDHLPTPPPIPEAIQRVIEQAAKDKEAGIVHDGFYDEEKYGYMKYQGLKRRSHHQQTKVPVNRVNLPGAYDDAQNRILRPGKARPGQKLIEQTPSRTGEFDSRKYNAPRDEYDAYINEPEEVSSRPQQNDMKRKPGSRIPSRRPVDQLDKHYAYNSDTDGRKNNVYERPLPGSKGTRDQYLPGISSRRPTNSGRKPNTQPQSDDDEYETETETDVNGDLNGDNDYDYVYKAPLKASVGYTQGVQKLPDKSQQKYKFTGKPTEDKLPISTTVRYNIEDKYDSQPEDYRTNQPVSRPNKPTTETDYTDSEDNVYYEDDRREPDITFRDRRPTNKSATYNQQKVRKPGQQKPAQDNNVDLEEVNEEQRGLSPVLGQNKETNMLTKYSQQTGKKASGYQYLPPQNRFKETEKTRYRPGKMQDFTTRRPIGGGSGKMTTAQPFITPNVYGDRDDDIYEDKDDDSSPMRKPTKKPGYSTLLPDQYESTEEPNYDEKDTEEDLEIGDEHITPVKVRPSKPVYKQTTSKPQYDYEYSTYGGDRTTQRERLGQGLNRHPEPSDRRYSHQKMKPGKKPSHTLSTTPKTEYDQTYETESDSSDDYADQAIPGSTTRPKMRLPGRPRPGMDGTTFPTTVTIPAATDLYKPTSYRAGYQDDGRTEQGVSRKPFDSPEQDSDGYSTTPAESYAITSTSRPDTYIEQTHSSSSPEPSEVLRKPTKTTYYPGTVKGRPIRPGQAVPSTTYRPNYTIIDGTTGRPVIVDATGTPIDTTYGSDLANQVPQRSDFRPNQINSGFPTTTPVFRPDDSGFGQKYTPNFKTLGFPTSSTTERIIGEDFSGPRRPQTFDPETGYHY